MTATIDKAKATLTIVVPINATPVLSSSGKTRLVATASGKTSLVVEGKPVSISLSAYIK